MKKLWLLVALLLCFVLPCATAEEEPIVYTSGEYQYVLLEDGTAKITMNYSNKEHMNIPVNLDGYAVTSIGSRAFSACYKLVSIAIPDTVINLDINPFEGCETLREIRVSPDHPTLAIIDGVLFNKNKKELVCYPCSFNAEEYVIPYGIVKIGDYAFSHNKNLKNISIPDSVIEIGKNAFVSCNRIKKISIPESVTTIGENAFSNCNNLVSVKISKNVTVINDNPFSNCLSLEKIEISKDNPVFSTENGVLINRKEKKLVCYPCDIEEEKYTVPCGIKTIGKEAFYFCEKIKSIYLPDSVTTIEEWAFYKCDNLMNIYIPKGVNIIGDRAFLLCGSIKQIEIPDSVTYIGDYTFAHCKNLTSINMPNCVTHIGKNAFSNCNRLTTITVPRDSYAAQYCKDNNLPYTYADANDWLLN